MNAEIQKRSRKIVKWCGIGFQNDLKESKRLDVRNTIDNHSTFTLSYISLLAVSTIICTLGLLLNAAPIVIGGMLIAPLMWPILKLSLGIVESHEVNLRHALILFLLSFLIGVFSASAIAFLSPIKTLNSEILSRTNPTLLDIFVAMAGGVIASLSVLKEKISDSLAGVAVATALMPPLCVVGIGLAFSNYGIAGSAFGLFAANAVSILFVAMIIFYLADFARKRRAQEVFRKRSIILVSILFTLVAIPLGYSLYEYTFQSSAYRESQDIITTQLETISPNIEVDNVEVTLRRQNIIDRLIVIEANVSIPEDVSITYQDRQELIETLRDSLGEEVDLSINIQRSIAVVSEETTEQSRVESVISQFLITSLNEKDESVVVDSITVELLENSDLGAVDVIAVLRSDPNLSLTNEDRTEMQDRLSTEINRPTTLDLVIVPRLTLRSAPLLELERTKATIESFLTDTYPAVVVADISISESTDQQTATINVDLRVPAKFKFASKALKSLKSDLESETDKEIELNISLITMEIIRV